jgi:hypothetical protein
VRPGHPGVAQRRGSARLNARVVRLHVSVRADDGGHAAVEQSRERDLLARRLCVDVDDDHGCPRPRPVDESLGELERMRRRVHEQRSLEVDHRDLRSVARVDEGNSAPRRARGEVRGTHDAVARLEVGSDVVSAPGVVAERDRVRAGRQQLVRELRRDPDAVGDVLAVDDADVDVELVAKRGQTLLERAPSGRADDIGDEEDPHTRPCNRPLRAEGRRYGVSVAAGCSSTDT